MPVLGRFLSAEMALNYTIDKNSFELKPIEDSFANLQDTNTIHVTLPSCEFFNIGKSSEVQFTIFHQLANKILISSDYGNINFRIENPGDWERFINSNLLHFVGLIAATLLTRGKEEFLWVEPSVKENVWILSIVWNYDNWKGILMERNRIDSLPLDYFLTREKDKKEHATRLFLLLQDKKEGLGLSDNPLFSLGELVSDSSPHRQLTIKVNPSEKWFLLFPINHFCQFQYGRLSIYKDVEWILSNKSFVQNTFEQLQIQNELSSIGDLLRHSVVILNTYPHFYADANVARKSDEGTALLIELFNNLQNVDLIDSEALSLQWHLNPDKEKIFELLGDNNIWYFFADFHVENGVWQLGIKYDELSSNLEAVGFPLDYLEKGDLKHIRLMRVFHCHSVFDPYEFKYINTNVNSITDILLNAGALRVEGSVVEENYLDYICSLLFLFCQSQGLQPILIGKCLEKGVDFADFLNKINKFLISCNWDSISLKNL